MAPSVEAPARSPRRCLLPLAVDRWGFVSSTGAGCVRCSPPPPPLRCPGSAAPGAIRALANPCAGRADPEPAAAAPAAAAAGKEIVTAMVLASPAPAPGCRLLLCPRPLFLGCGLPHSAEKARRWKQVPAVALARGKRFSATFSYETPHVPSSARNHLDSQIAPPSI